MSKAGEIKAQIDKLNQELKDLEKEAPPLNKVPNIDKLKKLVTNHINAVASNGGRDDDDDVHYIYEAAIEAFYGAQIWDWYNEQGK